jgi:hypothetical protein
MDAAMYLCNPHMPFECICTNYSIATACACCTADRHDMACAGAAISLVVQEVLLFQVPAEAERWISSPGFQLLRTVSAGAWPRTAHAGAHAAPFLLLSACFARVLDCHLVP